MANGFTQTVETSFLDWLFKQTAFPSAPTALGIALHSADPGDTGANELANSGGYARAALAPDTNNTTHTNWNSQIDSGAARQMSNKLDITFDAATADWNGGSAIKFFSIWSSTTYGAGTCYFSGAVNGTTGVVVLNGNQLKFTGGTPGNFVVTVD